MEYKTLLVRLHGCLSMKMKVGYNSRSDIFEEIECISLVDNVTGNDIPNSDILKSHFSGLAQSNFFDNSGEYWQ